jgi:hypothetical protein
MVSGLVTSGYSRQMENISRGPTHQKRSYLRGNFFTVLTEGSLHDVTVARLLVGSLKVHKREKFFGSDFEFFTIL